MRVENLLCMAFKINYFKITGYVGLTFYTKEPVETRDPFSLGHSWKHSTALPGLNPSDGDFARSRWCYDTPGAVHPDQVGLCIIVIQVFMGQVVIG